MTGKLLIILVVVLGLGLGFFYLKHSQPEQPVVSVSEQQVSVPTETVAPDISDDDTDNIDFKIYTNTKYGFSIDYPATLDLVAVDYDIQADNREYIKKCESGEYGGCGGIRWPEYEIHLQNAQGELVIGVYIDVIPTARYFGGVGNEGFTYMISVDDKLLPESSEAVVNKIKSSLTFITPDKPLKCLWTGEFVGLNVDRPGIDKTRYPQYSGYYYDQVANVCREVLLHTVPGQDPNIPFTEMSSCRASCVF